MESELESLEEIEQRFALVAKVELGLALLATILLVVLHIVCMVDNPALWRDEIAAINLAQVDSFQKYWVLCEFDSSFAAWFVVLRGWIAAFGNSDLSLRILGTGIGLGVLGVCWWAARQFHCKYPIVTLSLFCMNSAVIYWGDTVRGYGMGTLLLLIMLGQMWRFAREPSWKNLLLAFLPALLAVHTLYYNCIFLFAMCMGVSAVFFRARNWRGIVQILGLGFLCALTMLIYMDPVQRVAKWRALVASPLSMSEVLRLFNGAGGYAAYVLDGVWAMMIPMTLVVLTLFALTKWRDSEPNLSNRALFLLVTFCVGLGGYFGLLFWHAYQPQPWHFIPILGFVIIPIEAALMDAVRYNEAGRKLRLYFVVAFWLLVFYSTFSLVEGRRTSVDIATATINQEAKTGDLVVVQPWFYGVTFRHYHKSPADWVAVPGMRGDDLFVHRYDVLRDLMKEKTSVSNVIQQIEETLKAGHSVWYLGNYLPLAKEQPIGLAPPPITPDWKHGSGYHLQYWDKYFYRYFEDHANTKMWQVGSHNTYGFENAKLVQVFVWHEKQPEPTLPE